MDILYIVIPAYNEESNIEMCVKEWYSVVSCHNSSGLSRLVVVDDGSTDDTYQILVNLADEMSLLVPLKKENGGHGSAVLFGCQHAIRSGADWIFQTDSDGQTNPEEFELFWNRRFDYDILLGNRVKRGDGYFRKFVENVVCFLLWIIFGVRVEDANAPFRLMKSDVIARYINRIPRDFNIPNIVLTMYFVYFKERVLFLPISFKPRTKGKNTINLWKIVKIGWKAMWDFMRLKKDMKQYVVIK